LATTEAQMQAIKEAEDIDTGVDTRTKEEMLAEQMAGLGSAGKTVAENIPGVGEAILAKDIVTDASKGDYASAGLGTAALAVGVLPGGDILNKPIKAAAKKFRKKDVADAEELLGDADKLEQWRNSNKLPESQRQKNIPEAEQAAEDLFQGNIKSKEARKRIKEVFPEPKLYTAETMPEMPTVTDVVGAMGKKSEKGILGVKGFDIEPGQRVGARLDIPAYNEYDKWVVSIHDGKTRSGSVVGYGQAIRLKNITFGSDPKVALDIAKGKRVAKSTGEEKPMGKATIARVFGDYVPEDPYELYQFAKKVLADKDSGWTQVGMNPYRGSYFYDKATGNLVTSADEVIQVGPLVLAKNVVGLGMDKKPTLSEVKSVLSTSVARTKDGKLRTFNEGGAVPMKEQMEMFEDGGLMDEGGTVDPVSGNDVPPGSTQEEVRDDIPAQLSEGEFVFPADVVRYIGLGNLMRMRQEAKMGLKVMEEMGQMGNSEEATIPDDIPFDINDLDMEEEDEYNNEMEMAQGGLVYAQQGAFIPASQQQQQFGISGYQPAAAPTTGFAPAPTQAASQQFVQPIRPAQAAVPTMQQYKPSEIPTFQQTIGGEFGSYDELRQYKNEAGNIINVPFRNGQPISPIPEGYTYVDPEATATEEVTTTPTTPQTAQVTKEEGDGDAERQRREEEMYGPGGGRVGVAGKTYGVSFDMPEGFFPSTMGVAKTAFNLAFGKPIPETTTVNFKRGDTQFAVAGKDYNTFKSIAEKAGYNSPEAEEAFSKMRDSALEKKAALEKAQAEQARRRKLEAATQAKAAATEAARKKAEETKREQERIEQERLRELSETNINRMYGDSSDRDEGQQRAAERQREADSFTREAVRDVESRVASGRGFAEGGLASKPKPKKTKKMKRGGLASK